MSPFNYTSEAARRTETSYCNHARRAKRRSIAILHAGTAQRRLPLYKDLIKVAKKTLRYAEMAKEELASAGHALRATSLTHFMPLVATVIEQAERRVVLGEQVPAQDKIVSIFESAGVPSSTTTSSTSPLRPVERRLAPPRSASPSPPGFPSKR